MIEIFEPKKIDFDKTVLPKIEEFMEGNSVVSFIMHRDHAEIVFSSAENERITPGEWMMRAMNHYADHLGIEKAE